MSRYEDIARKFVAHEDNVVELAAELERAYEAGRASNHVSRLELFDSTGKSLGWQVITSSANEISFEAQGVRAVVT